MTLKYIPKRLIEVLKKINGVFISITNFFLTLIIYCTGVTLSSLLWRAFRKKNQDNERKSHWMESKKLDKKYEKYLKQY